MMARKRFLIAMAIGAWAALAMAQPAPDAPRFDVVSIVTDHAGTGGAGDKLPRHGTWRWTRIPLNFLVMYAYNVSLDQVAQVPKGFQGRDPAFDITAKVPPGTTDDQFRQMLQAMLAERFHFAMHREMRDFPVTTIEVAKGGAKLKPAGGECVDTVFADLLPVNEQRCGEVRLFYYYRDGVNHAKYFGRSVTVADLARELSANAPVVDQSGIQGLYDISVEYEAPMYTSPAADSDEAASRQFEFQRRFREAFEKQLGLTIDLAKPKKRPLPVIVVDHVELPTPN